MKRKLTVPFEYQVKNIDAVDGPITFSGYASTFGNVDKGGDVVMPGAFAKFLASDHRPVKMLWNHDSWGIPIGIWKMIREDDRGLYVEGELTPGLGLASDVGAAMKHGTITDMSIGYGVVRESEGEGGIRQLDELKLFEISPVNFPMNESAVIEGVKHLIDQVDDLKSAERLLREVADFPASAACDFVSRLKRIARREAERDIRDDSEIAILKDTVLKGLSNLEMRISK